MPRQSYDTATAAHILDNAVFPHSGQPNDPGLMTYISQVMISWQQRGKCDRLTARMLTEFLYKAAAKTYQSQMILRSLLSVLTVLGNYVDAERALDRYIELANQEHKMALKGAGASDSDDVLTIISTITAGLVMTVRCVRERKPALTRAQALVEWITIAQSELSNGVQTRKPEYLGSVPTKEEIQRSLADAWAAVGSAYMFSAWSAVDCDMRTEYTEKSSSAFSKSLELYGDDGNVYYEYALLQAQMMRDVPRAEELARRALEIDKTHLGASHVLSLCLSARDANQEARSIIKEALELSTRASTSEKPVSLVDKRMILQLHMTDIALIEATSGVQAALENVSDGLFAVYNELFTWDEDTVESQIHEASTSAIPLPKSTDREKKRSQVVPTVEPPAIELTTVAGVFGGDHGDGGASGDNSENDDDEDEDDEGIMLIANSHSRTFASDAVGYGQSTPGRLPPARAPDKQQKSVLEKLPQEHLASGSNVSADILAEMRHISPRHKGLSKGGVLRSIRRRLSDASLRSRKSSVMTAQSMTAANSSSSGASWSAANSRAAAATAAVNIIEKNKNRGNRVLRNSTSVDDAELKAISMQCLRDVWLLVAGLFRKAERWTESGTAITEATQLGGAKEDTFAERGFLMVAQQKQYEAQEAFEAALTVAIDYYPAIIGLAALLLELADSEQPVARDRAYALLRGCTHLEGWDSSEAWLLLGQIYEQMGSVEMVKRAYWLCIELEESRPVRRWRTAWLWDSAQYDL
ncbi:uncharacterized protein V1516DRAFT_95949 [Lipomyces oligophaga]|uniref:uncharacterized protein n=1 Tax=Lipomyces oligophaga TaxID=45792 RepID=UPI0034CFEF72